MVENKKYISSALLLLLIAACGVHVPTLEEVQSRKLPLGEHICVTEDESILESVSSVKYANTARIFVISDEHRRQRQKLSEILETLGWKVISPELLIQTSNHVSDLAKALGESKAQIVVLFYTLSQAHLNKWEAMKDDFDFTRILISRNVDSDEEIEVVKEFSKWGDGVFAEKPIPFSQAIWPKRILCIEPRTGETAFAEQLDQVAVRIHYLTHE